MCGVISSAIVGPIFRFHVNINAIVYTEHLRQHPLLHLCKVEVETPRQSLACHKAKTVLSFLEEEAICVMK